MTWGCAPASARPTSTSTARRTAPSSMWVMLSPWARLAHVLPQNFVPATSTAPNPLSRRAMTLSRRRGRYPEGTRAMISNFPVFERYAIPFSREMISRFRGKRNPVFEDRAITVDCRMRGCRMRSPYATEMRSPSLLPRTARAGRDSARKRSPQRASSRRSSSRWTACSAFVPITREAICLMAGRALPMATLAPAMRRIS